jgi:hypothetical protein
MKPQMHPEKAFFSLRRAGRQPVQMSRAALSQVIPTIRSQIQQINQEYEGYQPRDDNCLKCKRGTAVIIIATKRLSTTAVDNYVEVQWICDISVTYNQLL